MVVVVVVVVTLRFTGKEITLLRGALGKRDWKQNFGGKQPAQKQTGSREDLRTLATALPISAKLFRTEATEFAV